MAYHVRVHLLMQEGIRPSIHLGSQRSEGSREIESREGRTEGEQSRRDKWRRETYGERERRTERRAV